jgi:hypothetical protein
VCLVSSLRTSAHTSLHTSHTHHTHSSPRGEGL